MRSYADGKQTAFVTGTAVSALAVRVASVVPVLPVVPVVPVAVASMFAGSMFVAAMLAGCAPHPPQPGESRSAGPSATPTTAAPTNAQPPTGTSPVPSIGVSPGGVTTAVDAPAESTEDEYFQACNTARRWMATRPGDPHEQIEPYLAIIQRSGTPGPSTFNVPWKLLDPGRQSAVIVAVKAAADALCG